MPKALLYAAWAADDAIFSPIGAAVTQTSMV
jgi:hypothetical protein